ncbi:hypothetical protein SNOG_01352 [Parastagonospora nodorum SN15]|uniref:2EXR domain-containing protein n=1 Tax=Phaeosphaeria nodorum (strain SN15 / ATCC MYA-4574 / FGSC 10173) TaxID=321614 RepID=Q0V3R2_PHANO|nr:hypothetical protein SNOG_01352 [Parastagonospora nodorum SN15]EAT91001.1 hypothetical protein SNOG_01352 [Parastagonospora nodorum SN15]
MATPNHLPFINLTYSHLHDHSFEFFPMLTIELRLQIWEYAVQQTRFLKIYLEPLSQDTSTDPYSGLNALNKVVSNVGYTVTVKSLHCSSKLLASALPLSRTFVPFLHDLRAYDPKDVGILRLALDDELVTNLYHMNPSLAEVAYKSFILSLKTLQQIIWMASSPIGRPITGVRSNLPTVGYRFIHSMPIMSANASFDLLDPDLRPIQSELQYTATATIDPRKLSLVWHGFLTNTGIIRQPRPQELVLFAAEPWAHGPQVRNGDAAKIFLHEEHEGWLRGQEESSSLVKKNAGKVPVESPEEFEKAVRPAFGFWLVPMSALKDPEPSRVFSSPVCDLRGQNVELALAHLYE